jgi:hypothetical protein
MVLKLKSGVDTMKVKPKKPKTKKPTTKKRTRKNGGGNLREPWKPGESGNPNGRPKGSRPWYVILRERFEDGKISQADVVDAQIKKAAKGNSKSAELIWDRMDGKAKETHSIEGQTKVIPLDMIDNPQLKEELLRAELDKLAAQNKK